MAEFANRIRTRIVPALLTALGVTFLAAGILSFTSPVTADTVVAPAPTPSATAASRPTPSPLVTLPPLDASAAPTTAPPVPADRVATRVRIAALKIDLPVIAPPNGGYPPCNVALYFPSPLLGQPGQGRATYLYAHARTGMFLPMLTASKVSNGAKMNGMVVEVWTSDDQRFLYVVTQVKRHVPATEVFNQPFAAKGEELWLQTSEGVGPQPKLLLMAELLSQEASDHKSAHPVAKPLACR